MSSVRIQWSAPMPKSACPAGANVTVVACQALVSQVPGCVSEGCVIRLTRPIAS